MAAMTKRTRRLMEEFPKGCAAPADYFAWHDWAEAQTAHGLKQKQCQCCRKWLFPQERHSSTVSASQEKP